MKWVRNFICCCIGHKYFKFAEHNNGQSIYGYVKCQRCEKQEDYQYDF